MFNNMGANHRVELCVFKREGLYLGGDIFNTGQCIGVINSKIYTAYTC